MNSDSYSSTVCSADGPEGVRLAADSTEAEIQHAAEKLGCSVEDAQHTVNSLRALAAAHVARYEDCTPTRLNTAGRPVRVRHTPGFPPMGDVILELAPEFAVASRGQALPIFHVAPAPTSFYPPIPDPMNAATTLHTSIMAELLLVGRDEASGAWVFEHATEHPVVLTGLLLDTKSSVLDTCGPYTPYGLLRCGSIRFKVTTTDVLAPRVYVTYRSLESFQAELDAHTRLTPRNLSEVDVPIDAQGVARVVFWQSSLLCSIVGVPLGARIESVTALRYDQAVIPIPSPYVVDLDPLSLLCIRVSNAPAGSTLRISYGDGIQDMRSVLIEPNDADVVVVASSEEEEVVALYVMDDTGPRYLTMPEPDEAGNYTLLSPGGDLLAVMRRRGSGSSSATTATTTTEQA